MFFFQLRNELWKLFGKKRTYIGLIMFLLAQSIIIVLLRYHKGSYQYLVRVMEGNGYLAEHFLSNLTIAADVMIFTADLLLPLYVALVGGDLVAKETEDGTLRMILARPISRLRLLVLKWLAGAVFSLVLVAAVGIFGAFFSRLLFPAGGLFVANPWDDVFGVFDGAESWQRFAVAHLVLTVKAGIILSLAFMFSCFDVKPAAATILAISVIFIGIIIQNIQYFHDLREWIFTYHLNVWADFFLDPIPWWKVGESLSILTGFNLTFLIIGCTVFQLRDIKS
jgi:ABC-2 type transport system permease protein